MIHHRNHYPPLVGVWSFFGLPALVFVVMLAVVLVPSCAKRTDEPTMFTGRVLTPGDMSRVIGGLTSYGKDSYAEVNRDWLLWAYQDFRKELGAGQYGVTTWTNRSQCTFFTTRFEGYAQQRYFAQAFHSAIPAPGIAVGAQWYHDTPTTRHALCVVMTQRGVEFFDPQVGQFTILTSVQAGFLSVTNRKFD